MSTINTSESDAELQRLEELMRIEFLDSTATDDPVGKALDGVLGSFAALQAISTDSQISGRNSSDREVQSFIDEYAQNPRYVAGLSRFAQLLNEQESRIANSKTQKDWYSSEQCIGCAENLQTKSQMYMTLSHRCSICDQVWYCSNACQKQDWIVHKVTCNTSAPREILTDLFCYSSLSRNSGSTRLLCLLPGRRGATLHGRLIHTNVKAIPITAYEALSYTWGDPANVVPMLLNGKRAMITRNLYTALQHLRSSATERILWCDALCINQKSQNEKTTHLRQMPDIYSKAQRVLIWIGEATHDSDLAMDTFEKMASPRYDDMWNNSRLKKDFDGSFLSDAATVDALSTFVIDRPYWGRAWVVQEVMAAQTAVIMCGSRTMPWDTLKRAAKAVRRLHNGLTTNLGVFEISWANVTSLVFATQTIARSVSVLYMLWHLRNRECMDPRDKIYALVGLPYTEDTTSFVMDYALSTEEVYTKFATWHINHTRTLDVMKYAFPESHTSSLPSWVPDWRKLPDLLPVGFWSDLLKIPIYRAGTKISLPEGFFAGLQDIGPYDVCSFGGIEIDRIARTSPLLKRGLQFAQPRSNEMNECISLMHSIALDNNPYTSHPIDTSDFDYVAHEGYEGAVRGKPNRQHTKTFRFPRNHTTDQLTIIEAFWRTLVGDMIKHHLVPVEPTLSTAQERIIEDISGSLRPSRNFWPIWQHWYDQHQGIKPHDSTDSIFSEMVESTIGDRSFMTTENGYMGFASQHAAPGDLIVILLGSQTPCVLRPVPNDVLDIVQGTKYGKRKQLYEYRGDCYVQGVMFGEVISSVSEFSEKNMYTLM